MILNNIIQQYKLFWQYPVITEKTFNDQSSHLENYIGFPWATILDKKYNLSIIFNILKPLIDTGRNNITCCQHISFMFLIPLFKSLGIKTLYTPHKTIDMKEINGITIKGCPLYAVNIEDSRRNAIFKGKKFINLERKYLYSFQGAWAPHYLTSIRKCIFNMKHPNNVFIKNIGHWHFDDIVYNNKQNIKNELNETLQHLKNQEEYNNLLLESKYSLCPSGSGPNSIRLWESLAVGAIPIILADKLDLPQHKLWNKAVLHIKEKDIDKLGEILSKINSNEEQERRENCIKIYAHFKNNYMNMNHC